MAKNHAKKTCETKEGKILKTRGILSKNRWFPAKMGGLESLNNSNVCTPSCDSYDHFGK